MSIEGLVYRGHIIHIVRCDRQRRSAEGRYGPAQAGRLRDSTHRVRWRGMPRGEGERRGLCRSSAGRQEKTCRETRVLFYIGIIVTGVDCRKCKSLSYICVGMFRGRS